ncbi:mitochondrial glycerol-3-phosphate dehydrogenase [Clydaea vesicula]|uniref:Glycerol-3-phosphate dehydrogenase n=1 Tax=Clydaea vesicula TaxID=447962 RepID=A0AAD5XTY8_9FUNG|nr:mitochondrial glycerol-3-phosphate dehydrogenase [Clydaea vesicula]
MDKNKPSSLWSPPTRIETIKRLKSETFDLLIIGGGATGSGCAVDAATRGLKVALVEKDDFASGTSSRSTKLVHGGVRYLEKAFMEADYEQYKLVKEALYERSVFLKTAPYLSYQLPIMLPIYKLWKVPYYWAGSKAYDLLAGGEGLSRSYFLSKRKALEAFPMLKEGGLVGAMVYYDGAHNDSRMNVALILTAVKQGATVANHVEVTKLIKKRRETLLGKFNFGQEEICGAVVRDTFTGESWTIKAKGIINATGPFSDSIRKLDNDKVGGIVSPSTGVHIILPGFYSPAHMGLLDPATSDGRVIFFLPWEGNVIAGTTDTPISEVTPNPIPTEKEISWILQEVENYLNPDIKVRRGDVLAAWSGIRPLVRDPSAKDTAGLVRNHMINVSDSGLLTIAGGKWTTYRAMAADTIDKAIEVFDLQCTEACTTEDVPLVGTHGWSKNMFVQLIQHFGLETSVAEHLSNSYGDRSWNVASMASLSGQRWPVFGKRLVPYYPYIEAEVRYACRNEYACTAVDVLARRTRLAFLNAYAAFDALPRVIEIMGEELGWSEKRKKEEFDTTAEFLKTMGMSADILENRLKTRKDRSVVAPNSDIVTFFSRSQFLPKELEQLKKYFLNFDKENSGSITKLDLIKIFEEIGLKVTEEELKNFNISRLNKKGKVEFKEFLEILAAAKEVKSKLTYSNIVVQNGENPILDKKIDIERSGGGV